MYGDQTSYSLIVNTKGLNLENKSNIAESYLSVVVKDGDDFLHNSKTAKKDGVESTGNASKSSYKSPVSISPTNMYIENGCTDIDQMISSIEKGIMVIDVQGLHSGLNAVSETT